MSRSKWKNPYTKQLIVNKNKKNQFFLFNRSYEITPSVVGKTLKIYNGKTFVQLFITDEMIGYKAGEFIPTRIKFIFKKKRKLKKK